MEKDKHKFRIGEQVEVSSDDEGFRGAWYVATILRTPSSPRTSYPKRRAPQKALVEYRSLVSDLDEKKPLTEYVASSFIRPLPPPPAPHHVSSLEPLDVVDAFHRDGWWKGVVTKVEGANQSNSFKYTVVFEDPPEQCQFSSQDLRNHLDWINGTWVQPPKQMRMKGLRFSKGMAVEVNLDKETLGEAWFPATILEEIGFNSFLVECGNSSNNDETSRMKETVDCFHIRPPPPKLDITNYEILENVDVFHKSSWKGAHIMQILTEGRYKVSLKHTREERQFSQSEIRPHLLLRNGAWLNFSRDISIDVQFEEQSAHADSNGKEKDPEVAQSVECSSTATNDTGGKSSRRKLSAGNDYSEKRSSCKRSRKNLSQQSMPCNSKSPSKKVKKTATENADALSCPSKKLKKENSIEPLYSEARDAELTPIKSTNQETQGSLLTKCSTHGLVGNLPSPGSDCPFRGKNIDPSQQDTGLESEVIDSIEKRERLMNSKVTSQWPATGIEVKTKGDLGEVLVEVEHIEKNGDSSASLVEGKGGPHAENTYQHSDEVINLQKGSSGIGHEKEGEQHNIAGDGASEMDFRDYATKEAQLSPVTGMEDGDVLIGMSAIVPLENHMAKKVDMAAVLEFCNGQAVSTCLPGKRERKVENIKQSSVLKVPEATALVDSQEMPFHKSSSLWKNIESMEVFQVLPQKPHFRPLIECKEASREGFAIGHMLTFATLIEKTSKLQVEDSRKVFDDYLEVLADLEMLGFDVKPVVDRLKKLLSIKDRRELLANQSKDVDIQIRECTHEKIKLEEDIDQTDKLISELEERRAMKVSMKVMKDSEIIALQVDANVINGEIVTANDEFESLASAPW